MGTILEMVQYGAGGGLGSLLVSFILMLVFYRMGPLTVLDQIENYDNGAVGASFFVVSLLGGVASALWIYQPIPGGLDLVTAVIWLAIAVLVGGVLYNFITIPIMSFMCRDNEPKEGPLAFQRRELLKDHNVGLALFTGGILVSIMIPCIASALSA